MPLFNSSHKNKQLKKVVATEIQYTHVTSYSHKYDTIHKVYEYVTHKIMNFNSIAISEKLYKFVFKTHCQLILFGCSRFNSYVVLV